MASPNPSARPPYPQHQSSVAASVSSSTASSAFQSSSSLPSLMMPSINPASRQAAAPLPSPISQQPPSHQFGSLHPSSHQQSQRPLPTSNYEYRPERSTAGRTATETGHFLREYSLVAEAAKRAQMAVLARDLESMEM